MSMEFSRQEYWSGLPFPSPGHLSDPGIEPTSTASPGLTKRFFPTEPPGKQFQFSSVTQSCPNLGDPMNCSTPGLPITNSRSTLKLTCIESVMPSSHLILCCLLFLLPPIPPSIRVFSNESTLHMRWPKYWSFSFNEHLPKNTQD